MRTIYTAALASAIALSAFVSITSSAAQAGPIVSPGHYCLAYDHGGSDCSFSSYAQCQATASGIDAEGVDEQPWGRFVTFSDPDGNKWTLQQLPPRP